MTYLKITRLFLLILMLFPFLSCQRENTLFQKVDSSRSGIHFRNDIIENDSINQLDIENVYNGGGVGIGDFNRDGLPDIFFTGNVVQSKIYLSKDNFRFNDITSESGINTDGKWCRGVAVVDINSDGWMDIYISVTLKKKPEERRNLLYMNQGLNADQIPFFKEDAAGYGLDDDGHTTQAAFFDYDNDGDLDVYLIANEINEKFSPYLFRPVIKNGRNPSTGKLYRNDWCDSLNHPVFTDVSAAAGIQTEGYGHSASITDFNNDGWKDIYVGNDFFTNDLLWINNRDGTFTDQLTYYFKHTSANTMGNDIGDVNNDGLQDMITLDMNPEDNYRKKMMLPASSYQLYQYTERYNYSYQYVRNSLQLNQGNRIENDSTGPPVFSDIGYLAGITATDWSWTPMLTDFDNDGYRDLIISNGFPKDITDHDFAMFRSKAYKVASKEEILSQVPVVKLHNYAFRNNGNLTFSDVSDEWGMTTPSFSNGSAYADLDNDGDLDLVMNNINDEASLYRNYSMENHPEKSHFIRIALNGEDTNLHGIGSLVTIFYDNGKKQVWENSPFRGYLSTVESTAHFGLGHVGSVDSVMVRWQDGKIHTVKELPSDQTITINISEALKPGNRDRNSHRNDRLFRDITKQTGINYTHRETDFVDFNIQKLLPHKFSEYGPGIAAGDIDGNGLDDIVVGGSANNSAMFFLQQTDGTFIEKSLLSESILSSKLRDDTGMLLFDADNDGDLDLYIASGGYENENNTSIYQDHFYTNNGRGEFTENNEAISLNHNSKSCVRAADFDRDGDTDLFIAGRVDPWHYPRPVSSIILRNDSSPGKIKFTDVTAEIAGELLNIGLVCDALFTDFDNDGWPDLLLAGEWMPVTMLKNVNGRFRNITSSTGLSDITGWWNSIVSGDFDNDGDTDYIIGNLGRNSYFKASEQHPVSVFSGDFDNNGSYDAFLSHYLPASQDESTIKEFPVHGRDDAVKQMIGMRSKFQNYRSYATATIDQLFSSEQYKSSLVLRSNCFSSSFCRNEGNGKFSLIALPVEAQISVIKGMVADDFDGDGNLDIVINGNDWGTEVLTGRYDALNGLVLKGDGKGNFSALSIAESGIYIPGNGRGLISLKSSSGKLLLAAGQNRGPLKLFELVKNPVK
ncbi:MAG: RNA-binding protein [Bacteroidetes bacterium GWE2_41_25]|nr:MAG: RNA-binding protein [Bacteroidetes bacterium GWA2_40_15]OFX87049.1 MAG: RNA-binding protein [Bacteroidetes bacterium GWC2_40_22]OFY10017.1 MAG: RNA-binding protein [Bacteroidetes bacterium GWE2_41_25]OFY59358.1 MAG: RNA-binding protein [Bacteroidetes bacterium GWF2_41_9]HBH83068.1 RNA-binding protein [Bacteroidales bacterium]